MYLYAFRTLALLEQTTLPGNTPKPLRYVSAHLQVKKPVPKFRDRESQVSAWTKLLVECGRQANFWLLRWCKKQILVSIYIHSKNRTPLNAVSSFSIWKEKEPSGIENIESYKPDIQQLVQELCSSHGDHDDALESTYVTDEQNWILHIVKTIIREYMLSN